MASDRNRKYSLVLYLNEDEVKTVLDRHINQIRRYAFIVHDKDEGKRPHLHLLLVLQNAHTGKGIRGWFEGAYPDRTALAQVMHDETGARAYLVHKNAPNKVQYDESLVREYNWIDNGDDEGEDPAVSMLFERLNGCRVRDLAMRYGRDYIFHAKIIDEVVEMIRSEDGQSMRSDLPIPRGD